MIKVEEGKSYRTRDGRKASDARPNRNAIYPWVLTVEGEDCLYTDDGHWNLGRGLSDFDLVAEWTDEPAQSDDGWIDWRGGNMPVEIWTLVDVRLRDGRQFKVKPAGALGPAQYWGHKGSGSDIIAYRRAVAVIEQPKGHMFARGDRVRKKRGSSWQGKVCGFYSTELTPVGYAVESEREPGSVQIYPEAALELVPAEGDRPR